MITFIVPGEPIAKGRPRSTVRGGRVHVYTPERTRQYEEAVRLFAVAAGVRPLAGPVRLEIDATWAWPKSRKKNREAVEPRTAKPDGDNVLKVVDALNGIAWADDAQVADARIRKWNGPEARLVVRVGPLDGAAWEV